MELVVMQMKKIDFPMALLLLATIFFAPAVSASEEYTPIHGGEVTLDEFLVMDKDTPVPSASLKFSVVPGEGIEATGDSFAVLPGPEGISFKTGTGVTVDSDGTATLTFGPSDVSVNERSASQEDCVDFDKTYSDDEKYVKKTLVVDLSGVSFNDVGIYRYALTEAATGDRHLLGDSNPVRYLDVYVTDTNGNLGISAVFWRKNNASPGSSETDMTSVKSTGMTSRAYRSSSLAIEKTVEGNQRSRDQYFAFTVILTGTSPVSLDEDSVFTVSGSYDISPETNMATAYSSEQMQRANDVGGSVTYAELLDGKTFYLRHGQRVVISGISEGLGYVVTEAAEDYMPSCEATGDVSGSAQGGSASDDELTTDTSLAFHNVREGIIPTGVLLRAAVPVLLGVLGLLGLWAVILLRLRRRSSKG